MLIYLYDRLESLFIESQFEARKRLAIVTVLAARVHLRCQVEPLPGVLVLPREEMATPSIVDAAVVLRVNLDPRKVVIQRHVVRLRAVLPIPSRLMGSILDNVAFREPEFSRFEYVNFYTSFRGLGLIKWQLNEKLFLVVLLRLLDFKVILFWGDEIPSFLLGML